MCSRRRASMRFVLLLVTSLPAIAVAQNADKPKGRLIDPFARMPRPRDGMKLPDPRKAAEKATSNGTVAPTTPEPKAPEPNTPEPNTPVPPPDAPHVITPPPPVVPAVAELPPPSTPFRVTTLAYKGPPPVSPHAGLTLEVGIGFGMIYTAGRNNVVPSPGGVGGIDIGVGGWLSENAALTARIAGAATATTAGTVAASFLGPSLQIWSGEKTWLGFGFGLASMTRDSRRDDQDYALTGFGLDLRIGRAIYESGKHSINGSLEITPSWVKERASTPTTIASVAFLIGWQHL